MKLLGWMHRKFWQNIGDPLGEIATGPTCNCHTVRPSPYDRLNYFVPLEPEKDMQWMLQEPAEAAPVLFEGLLAIGTFGSPVFSPAEVAVEEQIVAVDEIAEKETEEATEKDLMVVTAELQKVLAAEVEKAKCSGDRTSSASAGAGGKGAEACPLQGFLLGLPVEVGETALVADRRRERRASLGELLMRSRAVEELLPCDMGEETPADGMHVMRKRMLKRRRSVRGTTGGGGGGSGNCDAGETSKFGKILRIFHRKIHPENATYSKKSVKPSKHEEKEMFYITDNCSKKFNHNDNEMDAIQKEFKREGISKFKCHSYPESSKGLCRDNSNGNHEHWIKTDAEYLVLEL